MGAPQHLGAQTAVGQVELPLHIGPHQTAHVEGVLHEMHVVVTAAQALAAQVVWRLAGNQQQGPAGSTRVVQTHDGVGRACIHMDHHGLTLARHCRHASGHVHGHVFMRAQNQFGVGFLACIQVGQGLDEAHVIGAQVGKHVGHATGLQVAPNVQGTEFRGRGGCGHGRECGRTDRRELSPRR